MAPPASQECLPHRFEPYTAPAGPGRAMPVGMGFRRGLWQSFGILDGMPSCISALMQDKNGDIWMGTGWFKEGREWGACRYDGGQLLRLITADGLVNNRVRVVVEDRQDRLWFGTYGGISCYDGKTFESYTTADGLARNEVWSLLEDRDGRLWVGSWGGLNHWDGQRFHTYTADDGLVVTHYGTDGQAFIGVSSILEDRQGQLWAGTWSGLSRWDGQRFHTYTTDDGLANNWVRCLLEDRQGQIWVGTGVWDSGSKHLGEKGGLSRWDGQRFHTYTPDDGLANDMVRCLAEDHQGQIWVGTWGGGASRWDGQRFHTYTPDDGLANNWVFTRLLHLILPFFEV